MTDLENHRRAVERILEDESLTTELTDDAAQSLLDWGLARVEAIAQQSKELSREKLDAYLTALRRTMKRIGRHAGKAVPEAQVERVRVMLAEIEMKQNLEGENGT